MALVLPFLGSSKCVLFLSDEGLGIYGVARGKVSLIDTIPWETEGFEESVAHILRQKCRGQSVVMLNDMVEQHYRKERVPRVGGLDKASILQRRLAAAFSSYPMRAALKLKEKPAQNRDDGAADTYLFAAVPISDNIRKVLNAVRRSQNSIQGLTLLPVESAGMVSLLSKKLDRLSDGSADWTVFVGQHRNGGLRQIVTRKGELALTRMTPIIDQGADPSVWAAEVAGEIRGTMSYLSRFGYDPNDGLDLIVIASHDMDEPLQAMIDFECNLHVMTSGEAGSLIGVRTGADAHTRYADALHAGWTGQKSKPVLPLKSALVDSITMPARIAMAASVLLFLSSAYFLYTAFVSSNNWVTYSSELETAQREYAAIQQEYDEEVARKKELGIDVHLIEGAATIYERLENVAMKPLKVLEITGASLGPDIRIESLSVTRAGLSPADDVATNENNVSVDPAAAPEGVTQGKGQIQQFDVVIRIVFPGELEPESGVRRINELQQRLQKNLPNHKVEVVKQVADLSYTGNFVGEATSQDAAPEGVPEEHEAQIKITGALQ